MMDRAESQGPIRRRRRGDTWSPVWEPLTDEQSKLVTGFLERWNCVYLIRNRWPSLYRCLRRSGADHDDIHQASLLGVMRAAQKFDPSRGVVFDTVAYFWVRAGACRLAHHLDQRKLGRMCRGDRTMDFGGTPVPMWDVLGVRDDADRQHAPSENDRLQAIRDRVQAALKTLAARDREIIELRFGLDRRFGQRTLDQVSEILGITRERVRQIEVRALRRISIPLQLACFDLVEVY